MDTSRRSHQSEPGNPPPSPTLRRSRRASRQPGRPATMPSSAPPCRSSARSCARRSTSAPARRCSTSPPATATSRSRPRAAGATWSPPTTCRRCSSAPANAPPPSGSTIEFREADAEALPFPDASFDVVVSTFGVMFTPDQDRAAAELIRVVQRGGKIGLANWTPEGFIGQLFKTIGKHLPPPAGRQVAGAVGHAGADRRAVRAARGLDHDGAAALRVPLSLAGALARGLQDLLRPGAQGLRRARAGTRRRRSSAISWR